MRLDLRSSSIVDWTPLKARVWRTGTVTAMAVLHMVGVLSQVLGAGPRWMRWHLADFGAPFLLAGVVTLAILYRVRLDARLQDLSVCLLGIAGVMSEVEQHLRHGTGDPVDVACYLASLTVYGVAALLDRRRGSRSP